MSEDSIQYAGELALRVIARIEGRKRGQVKDREAEILANLGLQHLLSMLSHLGGDTDQLSIERNGMLGLDSLFIDYIKSEFGDDEAAEVAGGLELAARAEWQDYLMSRSLLRLQGVRRRWSHAADGGEGTVLWALMQLIWVATGKSDAARETGQASTDNAAGPALAEQAARSTTEKPREIKAPAIYAGVLAVIRAALWDPSRRVEDRSGGKVIQNGEGQIVASLNLQDLAPLTARSIVDRIHVTESLAAHRLLRWLVAKVREQEHRAPTGEFRKIVVSGGLTGLAQVLGMKGAKVATVLGDVLDAMQAVEVRLPDGVRAALLSWTLTLPGRGKPGRVKIVVADPLLPTYESSLKTHGQAQREARRLIPMPSILPPLGGHRGSHGAQAALQILVLEELRRQARALVKHNCVEITPDRWLELAEKAGVSGDALPAVIEAWVVGTQNAGPFLMRPLEGRQDVYALAPAFEAESELIKTSGERERRGAQIQNRSFKRRSGL